MGFYFLHYFTSFTYTHSHIDLNAVKLSTKLGEIVLSEIVVPYQTGNNCPDGQRESEFAHCALIQLTGGSGRLAIVCRKESREAEASGLQRWTAPSESQVLTGPSSCVLA